MATKVEAARLLTLKAARLKDAGERSDLEAGMAKLFASETGKEVVEDSFRIHGGYGYSKEYEIERLYRDAPLLLIGEGTSEIQRMVIGQASCCSATRSEPDLHGSYGELILVAGALLAAGLLASLLAGAAGARPAAVPRDRDGDRLRRRWAGSSSTTTSWRARSASSRWP